VSFAPSPARRRAYAEMLLMLRVERIIARSRERGAVEVLTYRQALAQIDRVVSLGLAIVGDGGAS
jgi:hypothetical protein